MNTPIPFSERYRILSLIGHGGMGEVSKAWDNALNREVAIKLIHQDTGSDPRIRKCFYQEARAFALLRHPHILRLFDYGMTDTGQLYISMELVHGFSLHKLKSANLSLNTVIELITQILEALALAHARGLIHLDIKAENVLVTMSHNQLWTKIADFGLASLPLDMTTPLNTGFGTPAYMAPEQILNQVSLIGPCSDIYAAGIILYEALTGHLPFDEANAFQTLRAQINSPIPPIAWRDRFDSQPNDIKEELTAIVYKALNKKPWERFLSANEFKCALNNIRILNDEQQPDPIIEQIRQEADQNMSVSGIQDVPDDDINDKIRAIKAAQDSGLRWVPDKHSSDSRAPNYHEPEKLSESLETFYIIENEKLKPDSARFISKLARTKEYSTLSKDADRALTGHGIQRIICGGFGIGKTKLIKYLSENYLADKFSAITCISNQYHPISKKRLSPNEVSASIFLNLIQQLLKILSANDNSANEQANGSILTKLKSLSSDAAATLDTSFWNEASDFIVRLLSQAAQFTPVSLLIDDLQHCNIAVYRLLDRLNILVEHLPILSLVTYDPYELSASAESSKIGSMPCFHNLFANQIQLDPLPQQTLVQMLKSCWRIDDTLSQRIASASFGNPYYATALVQHLNQASRLQITHHSLFGLSPKDTAPLGVPRVIAKFFQTTLDEIALEMGIESEFYREILIRIAAFGSQMTMPELQAFWKIDNDEALADCWREAIAAWCERRMLILSQPDALQNNAVSTITFTEPWHADIIMASLPSRRARALKAQAAMALIECYEKPDFKQSWRIAQLWLEARDIISYLQSCQQSANSAFDAANLKFAFARCNNLAEFFDEIIKIQDLNNEYFKAIEWSNALILGAELAINLDNQTAFEKYCSRLSQWNETSGQAVWLAHIQRLNAKYLLRKNNLQRALETAAAAKESFEHCNDSIEAARTLIIQADCMLLMDNSENARQLIRTAMETFAQNDLPVDSANAEFRIARLEWFSGQTSQARASLQRIVGIFEENQAIIENNSARFLLEMIDFLDSPNPNSLETLQHLSLMIAEQGDEKASSHTYSALLIAAILESDWQIIHTILNIVPSKTADGALLAGTQACARSIEMTLNGNHFDADNEITTAIACFGPQNRRARAWCHTLLGAHAAITKQLKPGFQAFDRARNDFQLLNDRIGIASVILGQAALACACGQFDDAFSISLDALQAANEAELPIHSTLAMAIAASSCLQTGNFDKFELCSTNLPCTLPNFFKENWISTMNSVLRVSTELRVPQQFTEKIQQILDDLPVGQSAAPSLSMPSVELFI